MKPIFLALGLILSSTTVNATSKAVEMDEPSRCAVINKLKEENLKVRNFTNYVEVTDRVEREIIIDVITSFEFTTTTGQIYPNVTVEKIGIMKAPNGNLMVVFADKNDCVWSYYVFDKESTDKFFAEITKRGA